MLANPTFPANEYHRSITLSLLCSEWEEVGHATLDHQQMKCFFKNISITSLYFLH